MINPHSLLSKPAGESISRDQDSTDSQSERSSESAVPEFAVQLQQESGPPSSKEASVQSTDGDLISQQTDSVPPDGKKLPIKGSELPSGAETNSVASLYRAATNSSDGEAVAVAELKGTLDQTNLESDSTAVEQTAESEVPAELELLKGRHPRNTELKMVPAESEGPSKQRGSEGAEKTPKAGLVRAESKGVSVKGEFDLPFLSGNKALDVANTNPVSEFSRTTEAENTNRQAQSGKVDFTSLVQPQLAETKEVLKSLQPELAVSSDKVANSDKTVSPPQNQPALVGSSLTPSSQAVDRAIGNTAPHSGEAHTGGTSAADLANNFDNRVRMMMAQGMNSAKLQLSPSELGTLEIHLSGEGDQTKVSVVAHNYQARDLLEQQLPRLREALQQQGIYLSDASVSDGSGQSGNQHQGNQMEGTNLGSFATAQKEDRAEEQLIPISKRAADSQIDFYA